MSAPVELKIILKDEHKTLTRDWLIYDEMRLAEDDTTIAQCLSAIRKEFASEPDSIKIKTLIVVR